MSGVLLYRSPLLIFPNSLMDPPFPISVVITEQVEMAEYGTVEEQVAHINNSVCMFVQLSETMNEQHISVSSGLEEMPSSLFIVHNPSAFCMMSH